MSYVKAKGINETIRRNFEFYLRFKNDLSDPKCWYDTDHYIYDENGSESFEAFESIENHGKIIPCNDIETLVLVLDGKRQVNLHIKMWAQGIAEGVFFKWEIKESFPYLPDWVWNSLENQIYKADPESKRYEITRFLYLERMTNPDE